MTIETVLADRPGSQRVRITHKDCTVEITRLGLKDPNGPGDIGIKPEPFTLSQRQVRAILKAKGAPKNPLVQAALAALDAGTADFYGSNPSASVKHELSWRTWTIPPRRLSK